VRSGSFVAPLVGAEYGPKVPGMEALAVEVGVMPEWYLMRAARAAARPWNLRVGSAAIVAAAALILSGCYGGSVDQGSDSGVPEEVGAGNAPAAPLANALTGTDQIPTPGPIPGFSIPGPPAERVRLPSGHGPAFQGPSFNAPSFRAPSVNFHPPHLNFRIHG
jgi:hypothetical protein